MSYANLLFTHGMEKFLREVRRKRRCGSDRSRPPPGLRRRAFRGGRSTGPGRGPRRLSIHEGGKALRASGALRPSVHLRDPADRHNGRAHPDGLGRAFIPGASSGAFPGAPPKILGGIRHLYGCPGQKKWRRTCTRWLSAARWSGRLPEGETHPRLCSEK